MNIKISLCLWIFFLCFSSQQEPKDRKSFFNSSIHTLELFGDTDLGYYFVNLYVGDPPQKQTVIVDTGSELTAFPCSDCPAGDCGNHIDKHFDVSKSKSSHIIDCKENIGNYHCNCDNSNRCSFSIVRFD